MDILVLEDNSSRVTYFIEKFCNHNLIITESADEAIGYLENYVFDLIFLDNDLGENNGYGVDVVTFLSDNVENENNDAVIIIHSWNVPAASVMLNILPTSKFFPFGSQDFLGIG